MSRRVLRLLLAGVILAAVVVTAWTTLALLQARSDLTTARAALERTRGAGSAADLRPALDEAERALRAATGWLDQPGPRVAGTVPLVNRPVNAVGEVADAALAVVGGTDDVLAAALEGEPLLDAGKVDLTRLGVLADALQRAATQMQQPVGALSRRSSRGLPGAVAGPLAEAQQEFGGAPKAFSRAAAGVRALAGVLGGQGERRLLLVLQNNAELRGTGGLVSVFAQATASDGRIEIAAFRDVEDVADDPPDVVTAAAPPDYISLWGPFLANTTLWKNTNMSPDVPTSSSVLAEVAALSLAQRPDAIVWLDVPAIAAVLRATGPAKLADGRDLTADNAVDLLLSQAYLQAPDTDAGQDARRAVLRSAADVVVGRLLGQGAAAPSMTRLARELASAARGRHLALWSADDQEQALFVEAGLAGEIAVPPGDDVFSFAVQNLGGGDRDGNKLDYYARRDVAVRVVVGSDVAEVEQEVVLRNGTPVGGLPTYVAGGGTPGTTNNYVSFALPSQAEGVTFRRGDAVLDVAPRPAGDHAVVTDVVSLGPGTATTWRLRYRLPLGDDGYRLTAVPQPLAHDAAISVDLRPAAGVSLRAPSSSPLEPVDGGLRVVGPFAASLDLGVQVERPGTLERAADAVRRFWNEPVALP